MSWMGPSADLLSLIASSKMTGVLLGLAVVVHQVLVGRVAVAVAVGVLGQQSLVPKPGIVTGSTSAP